MTQCRRGRAGHSLLELLVALTMLGLVLAAVLGTTIRTWRTHGGHGARAELRAQLEAGAVALATDLRPLSAFAGDLTAGTARDSSLELRALVGIATLCDTAAGTLSLRPVLAPDALASPPLPAAGDVAWALSEDDTSTTWHPATITSARQDANACSGSGAVRIAVSDPAWPRVPNAPVRLTRLARWSLYRTADGWFLGRRDWVHALGRFDVVQPVAGPFDSYPAGGLALRYLDTLGTDLSSGTSDTRRIARVNITLRGRVRPGEPVDSQHVVVAVGER